MKGFIASVLAHVPHFKAAASATPIHIALSYDEEVGCLGAPDLVPKSRTLPALPALCIVGEPTGLRVGSRAQGQGRAPRDLHRTRRAFGAAAPRRQCRDCGGAHLHRPRRACRQDATQGARDDAFEPPYTTIHVGSLHGGTALNFVPDRAVVEFEIRDIPGTDVRCDRCKPIDAFIASRRRQR